MTSKLQNKDMRILLVDDDPHCLKIMSKALEWEGFTVEKANSGEMALEKISAWSPHLVLLDLQMEGLNGLETLKILRARNEYIATIFVSAKDSTENIIHGLNAGADDYICKPFRPQELVARVKSQLRNKTIHDELRAANEKLKSLIDIDDLTGLYNMRSIYDRLENEIERARRYDRSVCVIMLDLDFFKKVNDYNDHLFGSFVLSQIGKIIQQNIRKVDFAARYGGDEFIIVLTEINQLGAHSFSERLRKVIEKTEFKNETCSMHLTTSIGYAITKKGQSDIDSRNLVRTADIALYEAKEDGRNCVKYVDFEEEQSSQVYQLSRKGSGKSNKN